MDGFLGAQEIRRSLHIRDWEEAQRQVREWESQGCPIEENSPALSVELAWEKFLSDAEARELQESTLKKYRVLSKQMKAFGARDGLLFLKQWDVDVLRRFRSSWQDNGISALKKLERLRAFLRPRERLDRRESSRQTEEPDSQAAAHAAVLPG